MKTVFNSSELAHVWASGQVSHGRSPANQSFNGDAFYSYRTVIANRIRHGGKVAYVLDYASFSNTTSGHQSNARSAIPNSEKLFIVRIGKYNQSLQFTPVTLRDHYLSEFKAACEVMPSRYARVRAEQYQAATVYLHRALEVCQFFGLGTKRIESLIAARKAGEATAAETLKVARERALKLETERKARQAREQAARNLEQAQAFLSGRVIPESTIDLTRQAAAIATLPAEVQTAYVAKAKEHNAQVESRIAAENAAAMIEWRHGKGETLPYGIELGETADGFQPGALLRLNEDRTRVETSRGAQVLTRNAKFLWAFCRTAKANGLAVDSEVINRFPRLDNYAAQSIDAFGNLIAGCHRIAFSEIEGIAKALNLPPFDGNPAEVPTAKQRKGRGNTTIGQSKLSPMS